MSDVHMVKLGDVLTFVGIPEKITDPAIEKYVTVQNNGRGAIRRVIKDGKSPVPFTGYRIKPGQFIYSRIDARNGAFAIIPEELDNFVVSKDFPIFEVQNHLVISQYLLEFLKSGNIQRIIQNLSRGATNRQRIKEAEFLDFPFPLPSLEEQKRIVSTLDKAKSIQEAYERQLAALDELASSLFVKYFGHPSLSPKYKTVSIGDICKVVTGNSPSKKDINNYGNVIEWVKSDNLGGLHPSKAKEYLSEQGKDKGRVAPPGSILVTCIAGSRNSIGKCSLVDREITFNQQINAIYPSNNILSDFLYYQIKIFPYLVQEKISGGMKGIVNKSKFESIKIILPPKEIQEEFSKITQRIRIKKEYAKKSLDLSKNLFSSLELNLFYH